jgi:hypothetical protein
MLRTANSSTKGAAEMVKQIAETKANHSLSKRQINKFSI